MNIDVKARNEDGTLLFEGTLTRREVGFLLEYSINDLLMQGVQFALQEPEGSEEEPAMRIKFPNAH